jgi:hypothetical protein
MISISPQMMIYDMVAKGRNPLSQSNFMRIVCSARLTCVPYQRSVFDLDWV